MDKGEDVISGYDEDFITTLVVDGGGITEVVVTVTAAPLTSLVDMNDTISDTDENPVTTVVVYGEGKENGGGITEVVVTVAGIPATFVE